MPVNYDGVILKAQFIANNFEAGNGRYIESITVYQKEQKEGKIYTEAVKSEGITYAIEVKEVTQVQFMITKISSYKLKEMYNRGTALLFFMARNKTLTTTNDVRCERIYATNAFDIYETTQPNLYKPKSIGTVTRHGWNLNQELMNSNRLEKVKCLSLLTQCVVIIMQQRRKMITGIISTATFISKHLGTVIRRKVVAQFK